MLKSAFEKLRRLSTKLYEGFNEVNNGTNGHVTRVRYVISDLFAN